MLGLHLFGEWGLRTVTRIGNAVYLIFVDELGLLEREAHSVMTDAKNWRRRWHYEAREPPEPLAGRFVSLAERVQERAAEL